MPKAIWKGAPLLAPVPAALVTCGTAEKPNVLTVAWTGIVSSTPPMTYVSIRPERYSHDIIKSSGEFVINLACDKLVRAVDLCGVRSGRDCDKFKVAGRAAEPAQNVAPPTIAQSPLSLECRVTQVIPLGSHDMFLAEILAVDVDESLIDARGKLHLEQAGLVAYAHGDYLKLGKKVGDFGFSVRKKRVKNPDKK